MKLKAETWKKKCEAVWVLEIFAGLAILGGICLSGVAFMTKGGGHDISAAWPVDLLTILIGGIALLGRKITAVIFSLMAASFAVLLIIPCFIIPPHPSMAILIIFALLFCLPVLFTFRGWDALK